MVERRRARPHARHYAEDGEFDVSEVFTDTQPFRGHESMRRYWDEMWETWEGIRMDPLEVFDVGGGRFVVDVRLWGKGKRSGVEVDQRFANLYTLRDGRQEDRPLPALSRPCRPRWMSRQPRLTKLGRSDADEQRHLEPLPVAVDVLETERPQPLELALYVEQAVIRILVLGEVEAHTEHLAAIDPKMGKKATVASPEVEDATRVPRHMLEQDALSHCAVRVAIRPAKITNDVFGGRPLLGVHFTQL